MMKYVELVKEFLSSADKVELKGIEEDTMYFDMIDYDSNFLAKAEAVYTEEGEIQGFNVSYKEEGQKYFRSGADYVEAE